MTLKLFQCQAVDHSEKRAAILVAMMLHHCDSDFPPVSERQWILNTGEYVYIPVTLCVGE